MATAKMTAVPTAEEIDHQAALLDEVRRATIGEFEIYDELGHGGMATVFLAHEIALNRKVAIKVMSPSLLQSGRSMAERFKREAQTAAGLSHPHIIPIYGVRESGRLLYFVMKYVQGRSLDAIVKQHGALPIKMVQAILAQVGSALDYAHRNNVIHRDIKPANIMLDVDGWAVITDFGIAKATQAQGLTMTGATIGTPTYMSPEQCAAKEVTGATDQYSLGIATYEMLSGAVPFDADSVMGLMWHHFHDPPPPLRERRPDCPEVIIGAVERMLAKKPEDRWPTLEEAVEVIGTPPHNDPIRQQMKAFARGGSGQRILADHHTPASPPPRTAEPTTPLPPSPTTPQPSGPAVSRPPRTPAPPSTPAPLAPSPTVAETPPSHVTAAPTTPIPVPPRAQPTPPPPSRPAPPRPAAPAPPRQERRGRTGLWIGLALVAAAAGVGGWLVLGTRPPAPAEPVPEAPAPPAAVATVVITPTPASILTGKTGQLKALISDSAGHPLTRDVQWASSDTLMARVSASGQVTGVAPGTVNVTATSEGHTGLGTVIVTATVVPVARVEIEPSQVTVPLGETAALVAAPKDASGNTLTGRTVTWSSGNQAVASVAEDGSVTGAREGDAQILAVVEGKRATARVTVTPAPVADVTVSPTSASLQVGRRQQLSVGARDARGNSLSGRTVTWSSEDPGVATVNEDGAVVGVKPGQTQVTATIESRHASILVTVTAVPVTSVALAPTRLTIAIGETRQLTAGARDARNAALEGRVVRWTSSDPAVAQVSTTGTVTAIRAGTAIVTATIEGSSASATVTVPAPPTPVVVAQPNPTPPAPNPSQPAGAEPAPNQPPAASALVLPKHDVGAGGAFSCGITGDGAAVCWGSNGGGQLGDAAAGKQASNPVLVPSTSGLTQLVVGESHACALTDGGAAVCWGANTKGQLGSGRTGGPPSPAAVKGSLAFVSLAAGARHTCGLTASGAAWCWGDNNAGQLGDGTTHGANVPQRVKGDAKYRAVAAGMNHTCGLTQAGEILCWGDGFSGQLGRGSRESVQEPVTVSLPGRAVALAAGGEHTCGIVQGGAAFCWGANRSGEIGDGSKSERDRPVAVSGPQKFVAIAAGDSHTCGLTSGGDAYCWGRGREGQLGDGARADRDTPVRVGGGGGLQAISAGTSHTCGVTRGQVVVCWGGNTAGQLGDGTVTSRPSPAPVVARP
jgi:serine/threonine protein kinase/alpha-tubulin suppressor-like RCC1 family protein/uncharacterized protein YjdB